MDLIFLKPYFFIFLLLPAILLLWQARKKENHEVIMLPQLKYLEASFGDSENKAINWRKFLFFYLIWSILTFALADPNLTKQRKKSNVIGYDIMLLIDVSHSMAALDFSTEERLVTRLDITKEVVKKFINKRTNDRIGIIIFGRYAYLESPLTLDNIALNSILDTTEIGMAGSETAIGDAIGLAVKKLHEKEKNSRAIILITDGENTAGKIMPVTAANLAKQYDIPIFTIGIGKSGEAPFVNSLGQLRYAFIPLDINTLKDVAKTTNGKFYSAENHEELENIYEHINKLTATKVENLSFIEHKPVFHYFVFTALALWSIYLGIGYARNIK